MLHWIRRLLPESTGNRSLVFVGTWPNVFLGLFLSWGTRSRTGKWMHLGRWLHTASGKEMETSRCFQAPRKHQYFSFSSWESIYPYVVLVTWSASRHYVLMSPDPTWYSGKNNTLGAQVLGLSSDFPLLIYHVTLFRKVTYITLSQGLLTCENGINYPSWLLKFDYHLRISNRSTS